MLEITLQQGDIQIPLTEVRPSIFLLSDKKSYFHLNSIIAEWIIQNMSLSESDYKNFLRTKTPSQSLSTPILSLSGSHPCGDKALSNYGGITTIGGISAIGSKRSLYTIGIK
mgnify:CR=1 FL=1|jgi:hypothetical protein